MRIELIINNDLLAPFSNHYTTRGASVRFYGRCLHKIVQLSSTHTFFLHKLTKYIVSVPNIFVKQALNECSQLRQVKQ